jgi:hypothetical protein
LYHRSQKVRIEKIFLGSTDGCHRMSAVRVIKECPSFM